jgi:hypothetical protein
LAIVDRSDLRRAMTLDALFGILHASVRLGDDWKEELAKQSDDWNTFHGAWFGKSLFSSVQNALASVSGRERRYFVPTSAK